MKNQEEIKPFDVTSFEAREWAKEFSRMFPMVLKDGEGAMPTEELMLGWFASAIMAGYDHANRSQPASGLVPLQKEELYKLANLCNESFCDYDRFNTVKFVDLIVAKYGSHLEDYELSQIKSAAYMEGIEDGKKKYGSQRVPTVEEIISVLKKGRAKYYDLYTHDKRENKFLIEIQAKLVHNLISGGTEK